MNFKIQNLSVKVLQLLLICILIVGCKESSAEGPTKLSKDKSLSLPFLVVDLDGDGIELLSLEESNVFFDVDGDGKAEKTAWVKPDDGILYVMSRNKDSNLKTVYERIIVPVTTGYNQLVSEFDTNQDQKFNAQDKKPYGNFEIWPGGVMVWQDLNQNGILNVSEEKKGHFEEIDLTKRPVDRSTQDAALEFNLSGVEKTRGPLEIVQMRFEYEDSNVFWENFCKYLEPIRHSQKEEYKKRCIDAGYNPWNDGYK